MTYLGDPSPWRRLVAFLSAPFLSPDRRPGPPRPVWVIGHRGAARHEPENTLASFRKALDLGADGIETDVCVTRDGCFVLWHDAEPSAAVALARQVGAERYPWLPALPMLGSDLRRPVRECDEALFFAHYGYVRAREGLANPLAPPRAPEVPPARLEDLLRWIPGEPRLKHVLFDVKLDAGRAADAVRLFRLLSACARRAVGRPGAMFHFLSTQREVVSAVVADARREPPPDRVRLVGDFELPGVLRGARRYGLSHVSMGLGQRTWSDFRREVGRVARARLRGRVRSLLTWTLNEEDRLRGVAALGVDGIVTDDAPLLREIVGAG